MLIHYIIVRKDLPLGVCAAMITHAAGESGALYGDDYDGRFRGATAVVLEAKNEDALVQAERYLAGNAIPYTIVMESSGEFAGQLMAIGVIPGCRLKLGPKMEHFQCLKTLDTVVDRNEWGV